MSCLPKKTAKKTDSLSKRAEASLRAQSREQSGDKEIWAPGRTCHRWAKGSHCWFICPFIQHTMKSCPEQGWGIALGRRAQPIPRTHPRPGTLPSPPATPLQMKKKKVVFSPIPRLWADLGIITWRQYFRKLLRTVLPVEVKAITSLWNRLYIKWCIIDSLQNPDLNILIQSEQCLIPLTKLRWNITS